MASAVRSASGDEEELWDSNSGKINVTGILQAIGDRDKRTALEFLLRYFGHELK
jgi:hypothetical protein